MLCSVNTLRARASSVALLTTGDTHKSSAPKLRVSETALLASLKSNENVQLKFGFSISLQGCAYPKLSALQMLIF